MWPLESIPPPNTANRNKRRMVNFDFTQVNGAKEALRWGGDDKLDREKIRKRPVTPRLSSRSPSPRAAHIPRTHNPDTSTYVASWANTIPNHAHKTFTMRDTIFLGHKGDRNSAKRPTSRGVTSSNLGQYSSIPVELERQKSNLFLKPAVKRKQPGILDTINAADRAIRHIQVKNDKEDENYQHLIDFHRRRYNNAQIIHPNYVTSGLEQSKALSVSDPSLASPVEKWNKDNWRSKISRTYKEDYMNILERYKEGHKNHNSGIVKDFYRSSEDDLSTQIDLRRYHHAI